MYFVVCATEWIVSISVDEWLERLLVTLRLVVVQLSGGEVACNAATFTVSFMLSSPLPPFQHVSLPPSPQQLKALEGVWVCLKCVCVNGGAGWLALWVRGRSRLVAMAISTEWQLQLDLHLLFAASPRRKCYNFPAQEMAFLQSVAMPTESSCCLVLKRVQWLHCSATAPLQRPMPSYLHHSSIYPATFWSPHQIVLHLSMSHPPFSYFRLWICQKSAPAASLSDWEEVLTPFSSSPSTPDTHPHTPLQTNHWVPRWRLQPFQAWNNLMVHKRRFYVRARRFTFRTREREGEEEREGRRREQTWVKVLSAIFVIFFFLFFSAFLSAHCCSPTGDVTVKKKQAVNHLDKKRIFSFIPVHLPLCGFHDPAGINAGGVAALESRIGPRTVDTPKTIKQRLYSWGRKGGGLLKMRGNQVWDVRC